MQKICYASGDNVIKPIRKAVFPVAGLGTRFLPATKAIPKEMLPIIDKPLIQYAVEEAIAAGITEMIFVTGRSKAAIGDHFDANLELEAQLVAKGKIDVRDMVHNIVPEGVSCIFVRQPTPKGLGDAVLCAAPAVGDAPFAVLLADDLMRGSVSPTEELVTAYAASRGNWLSVLKVEPEAVTKYGIVRPGAAVPEGEISVAGLVEKPSPAAAPSHLAAMGRYVFEPEIFTILRKLGPGFGGEIQLADAIDILAAQGKVRGKLMGARHYDCGSKFGYMTAIIDHGLGHDDFRAPLLSFLKKRLAQEVEAESRHPEIPGNPAV